MKHYLTSTCEILYVELPLKEREVGCSIHQGMKIKCLYSWKELFQYRTKALRHVCRMQEVKIVDFLVFLLNHLCRESIDASIHLVFCIKAPLHDALISLRQQATSIIEDWRKR